MTKKLKTYDGTAKTPAIFTRTISGLLVEGPMLWLASRNGICKGFPHRIEFRSEFYRINGKAHCPNCASKMLSATIYKTTAEDRRHVARLRKFGASNYEIAKALGIPEDAPVLQE